MFSLPNLKVILFPTYQQRAIEQRERIHFMAMSQLVDLSFRLSLERTDVIKYTKDRTGVTSHQKANMVPIHVSAVLLSNM